MADSLLGWWCIWARWHPWRFVARVSQATDLFECKRCHRQWALNHDTQITLPWHLVAYFYRPDFKKQESVH